MRLTELKKAIEEKVGSEWQGLEPETIEYELRSAGIETDKLLTDKIGVLLCLYNNPSLLIDNGLFFLHTVDVLNNNVAQFTHLPVPNSLELAWAIKEIEDVLGISLDFSNVVKNVVTYILKNEGYTYPTKYFTKYVEAGNLLGPDEPNKEKAIGLYLEGMVNGISS